ncbi:TonB-dependent receptor [Cupriavidus sp. WS]|uniref:TonB-dependent receptor family protein n=1 Tax=Cupriavidus sp. WS TaxID=1312922 RepID=UPI0003802706|nr:TonB-dependent receptor [Cupriavidus sp. WS]
MKRSRYWRRRAAALPAAAFTTAALAQAGADVTVTLPAATVTARAEGSLTVPAVSLQKETLFGTAGSVGFVDAAAYGDSYASNLRDVLKDAPGVYVQERYGQELRLSVRGSGIARGYHVRGLEILQDGVPTNFADGSGDYYQIDPLALSAAEVYKGGNGLAYGSTTLGGALNFTTPTAFTAEARNEVRVDGGSFGTARASGQVSRQIGAFDFLASLSVNHADGFRAHERGQYEQFNANFGYRFSPAVETRFYLGAYVVDQQLPGSLSLGDALGSPRKASASALSGDQARDTRTERVANVTTVKLDSGQLDFSTWVIHKSLYHPIFQVVDQDYWTYGFAPRYTGTHTIGGLRNQVIAGARFFGGNNDARQFVNNAGNRGAQTLNAAQDAYNYEAYLEDRLWVTPTFALMAGAKAYRSVRDYHDYGGLPANPAARSDRATFSGVNPKFGVLWEPARDVQAFADITRSTDVPDFTDLSQTIATTTRFVPLAAQHGWTMEIGTRGKRERFAWDVTAYRSLVRDQLLQYTTNPDVPASTFNAGRTTLQGVELGVSGDVLRNVFGAGDALTLSQLWNYSDFRFDNDAQYGNNRIAGVPEHVLRTTVAYSRAGGLRVAGTIDWVPGGAYVDYANTLRTPGYALFGLQASYAFRGGVTVFLDARNLGNKRYVSDFSTVTDARTANTAVFYPGTGRAFYAGVRYRF